MAAFRLPLMEQFNLEHEEGNLAARWEKWTDGLKMYLIASGTTDAAQKKSTLLYCAGDRVRDIFSSLPELTKLENEDDFVWSLRMLQGYFDPKKNVVYERHIFFTETMHTGETINSYTIRLRKLAKTCNFDQYNSDQAIRDQIVRNCTDARLRTRFLKEDDLDLAKLTELATAHERALVQSSHIEYKDANRGLPPAINAVTKEKASKDNMELRLTQMQDEINRLTERTSASKSQEGKCNGCGNRSHERTSQCPAWGVCHFCKKENHFKTQCNRFK